MFSFLLCYFAFLAVFPPLAMLSVVAVVTSLSVQVDVPVTVETPDPALAPTLPARHAPRAPTLVTCLDHTSVRHCYQSYFISEHSNGMLFHLPG